MKTAIPDILRDLGESEYTVLASAYCKLQGVRDHLDRMHDDYLKEGILPPFERVEAARILLGEVFDEVEEYVLALAAPGEDICPVVRKAA